MKQSIKTIISIVMAFTIAILCMPMSMASEVYSGTCGDNLTWTLDTETGELVISGEGEMKDYGSFIIDNEYGGTFVNNGTAPWFEYADYYSIHSLIINEGVTTIGLEAFQNCYNLKNVILPETLISISYGAFEGCNSIEKINIPNDVVDFPTKPNNVLGSNMKELIIGDKVTRINSSWFADLSSIEKVKIGKNVSQIDEDSFLYVNATEITVDIENMSFSSDEYGVLYDKDKSILIRYPAESDLIEYHIPDSVTTIGKYAFADCSNLKCITIPDSVTTIENGAFYMCTFENIVIPNGVVSIGMNAFNCCMHLKEIVLPDSVTYLGARAFNSCDELLKVTLSNNIETVEEYTFAKCVKLSSVILGYNTKKIGEGAFSYSGMKTVVIHKSLKQIDYGAFCACDKLTEIYYTGSNEEWHEIVVTETENEFFINATVHFVTEPEHKHELTHRTVASTCTVAGMEYDICLECGESFNIVTLPLASHSWTQWMTRTEATGSAYGEKYRTCTVCGKEETDSIPKLNVIEDEKTGIEIEFDNEYNSDVKIKVEEVFDGSSFELLEKAYGGVKSKVFDISTIKDGIKVQPDGKVKVRIPLPNGFGKNPVWVNYIDSVNGTVTKIPSTVVNGYVEFETDHFSYYAVVEELSKVNSVSIDNISMNYKDATTITPSINADAGVKYTVSYSSSDTGVAQVDANGKVTATGKGSATITCTVTDEYDNTVTDTCKVEVKYSWWQWIIVIVLFGWIWY